MAAILEPFDDLVGIGTNVDFVLSGITPAQLSAHYGIVEGRQIGSAVRHDPASVLQAIRMGFYGSQLGILSDEYWTVQVAFRWERQSPSQLISTIDLFNVGPFGLRMFLTPSNKATGFQTFVVGPMSATNVEMSLFTTLTISQEKLIQGQWYVARMRVRIHPTLGSYNLSIVRDYDGVEIVTFSDSGMNTAGVNLSPGAFSVLFRTIPGISLDDLKVTNGSGDNAIEPVSVVVFRRLTFAGSASMWNKSNAALENYQHVDDFSLSSPDTDTDTVSSAVPGSEDLYGLEAFSNLIPSSATINRVNINFYGAGSPSRTFRAIHRSSGGSVNVLGSGAQSVLAGGTQRIAFDSKLNPNGNIPWTLADLNPSQFGMRVES